MHSCKHATASCLCRRLFHARRGLGRHRRRRGAWSRSASEIGQRVVPDAGLADPASELSRPAETDGELLDARVAVTAVEGVAVVGGRVKVERGGRDEACAAVLQQYRKN